MGIFPRLPNQGDLGAVTVFDIIRFGKIFTPIAKSHHV
jgi:hypothetical protein